MAVQHPKSETAIANMFDRVAPRYDFLNALLSARQDRRWRRHLVARIPYRPAGKLLDMATGTGDVVLAAASAHPEYAELYGADISTEMLSLAGAKAGELSDEKRLTFKRMSAAEISLPDQSFDCLTISFGLRNVVAREQALKEFSRVLKPQGTLIVLEFFLPSSGFISRFFQFYFHRVLPMVGAFFSDKEAYRYLPESVGSFYSAPRFRSALYDHGFTVDGEKSFLFGGCRLFTAHKRG